MFLETWAKNIYAKLWHTDRNTNFLTTVPVLYFIVIGFISTPFFVEILSSWQIQMQIL